MTYKVVHYINQFFAGIGGEEKADIAPEVREGVVGPGMALNNFLKKGDAEVVATIICGDSYFAENMDSASDFVVEAMKKYNADGFVAGPAFNAGRYGTACGAVCKAVGEKLGIPTVSAMYVENPGVDLYKKYTYIVSAADSARGMGKAIPVMASLLLRQIKGEKIGTPKEEGYIERGVRVNKFYDKIAAERAVEMLVKKLKGEEFQTEYPMPVFDRVEPRPAVADITKATIAVVTSGGIVPFGNPDHIAASSAQNYGEYNIAGVEDLKKGEYQTAHGGYDQTYANEDPDRVLPVDVLRKMEKEHKIGKLYDFYYATVGNGTGVANAKRFGTEIGKKLHGKVDAVILTST
jgi:betaine reductase